MYFQLYKNMTTMKLQKHRLKYEGYIIYKRKAEDSQQTLLEIFDEEVNLSGVGVNISFVHVESAL